MGGRVGHQHAVQLNALPPGTARSEVQAGIVSHPAWPDLPAIILRPLQVDKESG